MKRIVSALIVAVMTGAAALPAETTTPGSRWTDVALFDWIYSGEASYAALKQASEAAGDHSWVSMRLERGDKVPQASARDLALNLEDLPALGQAQKDLLKKYFADESRQMAANDQDLAAQRLAKVDAGLVESARKLDALEASLAKNNYGKASSTGLSLTLYNGFRDDDPAGMVQGEQRGYFAGGMEMAFSGTVDKVNYNFTFGTEYEYNNLNSTATGQLGPVEATGENAIMTYGNGTNYGQHFYYGAIDAGASFQFPLGESGGLDIQLGSVLTFELSPLLYASIEPINTDAFFQDVLMGWRPPKIIKTMELAYPAATASARGVSVRKQGAAWWWPFTSTTLVYSLDTSWWAGFDPKFAVTALRLDEDLGQRGDWLDGGLLYGMVQHQGNDADQMTGGGFGQAQNTLDNPFLLPEHVNSAGAGAQMRFSAGSVLNVDAAASNFDWVFGYNSKAPIQQYKDTAFLGTLTQPVGPINFGFQLDQVGPRFLSTPRTAARNQTSYGPGGAFQDSIASTYPYVQLQDMNYGPTVPLTPPPLAWISVINQPTIATNNTRQVALKGEWHGSWISAGVYDGAQEQINGTEPLVWTTPYIEGNQNNGYGWFRIFGNNFGDAPPPSTTQMGDPHLGGYPNFNSGQLLQQAFNNPTDGRAVYAPGQSMPVHWQGFYQLNNYEAEFQTWLTKKGAGDPNLMDDSVKTLNYGGCNLLFDLAALMNRNLPLEINVVAEDRDLDSALAAPSLGGMNNLFNQVFGVGFLTWGVSDMVNVLATAGYEHWQSDHSYYPLDMQIKEFGIGADLKADPYVTGLVFNFRISEMRFDDLYIPSRELSLETVSVGSTLSY